MIADLDNFKNLQDWYAAQCDGSWEHQYGISIETLDNPGWRFRVELSETELFDKRFEEIKFEGEDKNDWHQCWVKDRVFEAACGPLCLNQVIAIFLNWAKAAG